MSDTHKIGAGTIVRAHLSGFGRAVLGEHLDLKGTWRRDEADLPLWELAKIFGPSIISGLHVPFTHLEIRRPEVETRRERRAAAVSQAIERRLRDVMTMLGRIMLPSSAEALIELVDDYRANPPPMTPTEPGFWWLGDKVVRVVDDGADGLAVLLTNNHRRPIDGYGGWAGPACRDPRIGWPS